MRAELKSLDSADAAGGLASFRPDDPEDFALAVGAVVGPPEAPDGDLFYFTVCTGRWLSTNPPQKGFAFLRDHLLLDRWSFDVLHRAISDLCAHTEGSDWNEIATKLSRYGSWEFEDYREAQ